MLEKLITTKKKPRRSRYTRDEKNPPKMRLTDRDTRMVKTVYDLRFASAKQVSLLIGSHVQTCRIRLYLLWQNKFVDRLNLPIFVGEGSPPAIYVLGAQGRRLIAEQIGLDSGHIPRTDWRRNYFFLLHHTLRRNDFRAALYAACRQRDDLEFLFWKQDKDVGDSVMLPSKTGEPTRVPLVPDGFIGLDTSKGRMYAYVEIDRGTITLKKFLQKQRGYFRWWQDRGYVDKYGERNFRVLYVTTNESRMENLIKTTWRVKESNQGSGFFWFTTFNRIDPERPGNILSPIWRTAIASDTDLHALLE